MGITTAGANGMSEKRKPDIVMLVRAKGSNKSNKLELYRGTKWYDGPADKYRIRVNGKFFPDARNRSDNKYYALDDISDIIANNLRKILA